MSSCLIFEIYMFSLAFSLYIIMDKNILTDYFQLIKLTYTELLESCKIGNNILYNKKIEII